MADPRLDEVEELLQATVFHPSPQRLLRERVLHTAAKAQHHHSMGRRALWAVAGTLGAILLTFAAGKYFAPHATAQLPAAKLASPSFPPSISGPSIPASTQSLGEALYR